MSTFFLRRHVYVCFVQDRAIFLDVRRDKYLGLGGKQLQGLATVVSGWPSPSQPLPYEEAERIGDLFVREGLLTREPSEGKTEAPAHLDLSAFMTSIDEDFDARREIRARDLYNFLRSCAAATWAVKWRRLESTVNAILSRKQRATQHNPPFDMRSAAELVDIFRRLRCYLFSARDHCLFHSLALVNFLALYGLYPSWVSGVRAAPWGAHSWVQEGTQVLDATPEEVRFYTPILVI